MSCSVSMTCMSDCEHSEGISQVFVDEVSVTWRRVSITLLTTTRITRNSVTRRTPHILDTCGILVIQLEPETPSWYTSLMDLYPSLSRSRIWSTSSPSPVWMGGLHETKTSPFQVLDRCPLEHLDLVITICLGHRHYEPVVPRRPTPIKVEFNRHHLCQSDYKTLLYGQGNPQEKKETKSATLPPSSLTHVHRCIGVSVIATQTDIVWGESVITTQTGIVGLSPWDWCI